MIKFWLYTLYRFSRFWIGVQPHHHHLHAQAHPASKHRGMSHILCCRKQSLAKNFAKSKMFRKQNLNKKADILRQYSYLQYLGQMFLCRSLHVEWRNRTASVIFVKILKIIRHLDIEQSRSNLSNTYMYDIYRGSQKKMIIGPKIGFCRVKFC